MIQNSRELSATQDLLKHAFYYAPNTRVPVWLYRVPRLPVQYQPQWNFAIFNVIVTT